MAAIPREKILARCRRLETKQARFKPLQEKLWQEEKRIREVLEERESMKLKIIGQVMLERMATDPQLKAWFDQEIERQLNNRQERDLFSLN